jgi:hypothetical protein
MPRRVTAPASSNPLLSQSKSAAFTSPGLLLLAQDYNACIVVHRLSPPVLSPSVFSNLHHHLLCLHHTRLSSSKRSRCLTLAANLNIIRCTPRLVGQKSPSHGKQVWKFWNCLADSKPRAIPVDIVQLLSHIDAFQSAQPDIRTLRLCNRFGKVKHARVAKLPKEIVDMIEQELLVQRLNTSSTQRDVDWPSRYCYFESSCRPADHAEGYERKLLDQAIATVRNQHPHLGDTSSPSELKKFAGLVDHCFESPCRQEGIELTTISWFATQGWKTAMTDQREGELPRYRTVSTRIYHLHPCLIAVQAHSKALWPGALCHARKHGHRNGSVSAENRLPHPRRSHAQPSHHLLSQASLDPRSHAHHDRLWLWQFWICCGYIWEVHAC